ncbi:MAG: SPASM domain-containing protein [Oligoflexia bacterium]|nr:SPASM domain-containing protein [Oligoflexia bacterium]
MKKIINRLKMLYAFTFATSKQKFYPQEVVLELTNACNLECIMCPHKKMKRKIGLLDSNLFKKIIDEISEHSELLYLHGTGESLIHPQLSKLCLYAHQKKLRTCLSTNGMLLTEELLSCGLDYLIIALDGGTAETYEKIRVGGNFNKLINNIKNILKVKSSTKICLQMIYMPENSHEVAAFKNLFTKEEQKKIFQFRFKPFSNTYAEKVVQKNLERPCFWPWNMMFVCCDGTVSLCCIDYEREICLGDLKEQSVFEIWNSPQLDTIRKHHQQKNRHQIELCSTCSIPEKYKFNLSFTLASAFLSAYQVKILTPIYERISSLKT